MGVNMDGVLCDHCEQEFTEQGWNNRHTHHEDRCPNENEWDDGIHRVDCDCDLNYHADCCPVCASENELCNGCGDELVRDGEPYDGENNEPLCENCYEDSQVECCVCGESVPKWEVGRVGDLLAVTRQIDKRILLGVYRIVSHPYHWSNYLNGGLYADSLTRIGGLPETIDTDGYPVGFICARCKDVIR